MISDGSRPILRMIGRPWHVDDGEGEGAGEGDGVGDDGGDGVGGVIRL